MHMSDQNGGDVYNHSGMPTISAPNIGSALSTGAKYAGIGVGAAIASPFAITAGLGYGVGKAVGKSIENYTKRTTPTPRPNKTTKKKPSSSASNSVSKSKLPQRVDAALPVPDSSTLTNPNMQGAIPGLNTANLPTALPVGNLPTALANGLPSNLNPTALANGIPGMPSNFNPANMQQMAQNALTPDAIKEILEEETEKIKREIMHLPFAKMLMGQKEKILLKVDKEGAQERLCNFFYKRLQKILDTSQIINDDLDIIYGYSVNQIYTANEKEFREYSSNRMYDIVVGKVNPLFKEANAEINTWVSYLDFVDDHKKSQIGGEVDPEKNLSASYKSFLDEHEKEMVNMFELQTGEMIDIDDAVQVQQVVLYNIFKRLDKYKNESEQYNDYMRAIVLHPEKGILKIFRKQVKVILEQKPSASVAEEPTAVVQPNAEITETSTAKIAETSQQNIETPNAGIAEEHQNTEAPVVQPDKIAEEPQPTTPVQSGGATGDFKDHYQVPDYMPSGHDWQNLKYCITKKVATDVQASIEKQTPEIKQMCKNIIYFQLYSYLTDYTDTEKSSNEKQEEPSVDESVAPSAETSAETSSNPINVDSREEPLNNQPVNTSGFQEIPIQNRDQTGAIMRGGAKSAKGLFELTRTFVIKLLDDMCFSLSAELAKSIFASHYLIPDKIELLMRRINSPNDGINCPAIKVEKYTNVPLEILGNLQILINNPPSKMLEEKYSDTKYKVPSVFQATNIDSKKFKQNLWYRGIDRFGKNLSRKLSFGKTPVERVRQDVLEKLAPEDRDKIESSPVDKQSNFTEGAISSFLFYQSHPYMLKIIYDKLEPVFRSISLDYDENFTRIFYYSSIQFMRTVAKSIETQEVQEYIKQYVFWGHVAVKEEIDKWVKFFTKHVSDDNSGESPLTTDEKITHWIIFTLQHTVNKLYIDIPDKDSVMQYFETTFKEKYQPQFENPKNLDIFKKKIRTEYTNILRALNKYLNKASMEK